MVQLVPRNAFIESLRTTPPATTVYAEARGRSHRMSANAHQLIADFDALIELAATLTHQLEEKQRIMRLLADDMVE